MVSQICEIFFRSKSSITKCISIILRKELELIEFSFEVIALSECNTYIA